jgi:hypothetical protein
MTKYLLFMILVLASFCKELPGYPDGPEPIIG